LRLYPGTSGTGNFSPAPIMPLSGL